MSAEAGAHDVLAGPQGAVEVEGRPVLAFLCEVAGGRKLLTNVRDRAERGASQIVVAAPQNQPTTGQIVDRDEIAEAAESRVDVTQAVLAEFGIESEGLVGDTDLALALNDAVRAFEPAEVLLSCLPETRLGLLRRDFVEWAKASIDVPVTHVPVRIEDDAIRWDVTHTLVVATQTVASGDLLEHLKRKAASRPHRYTIISPKSGELSREQVCERLARTLSELYRAEIDATGQPMSPAPLAAVRNAIEHYRIDEVLVSTLGGERSAWIREGLLEEIGELTDKPVEHVEEGAGAPVAAGATPGEGES